MQFRSKQKADTMKKHELGKTGIKVTPAGFGVMTINKYQLNFPLEKGADLICYALEKGINFFDTAQYYETYDYINLALKKYFSLHPDAERPVICSKSLEYSYSGMKEAVNQALTEMDIDYLDIFLLHEVRNGSDFDDREEAFRYLKEAKKEGIIKAIGVSTHYVDVAERMADISECDVVFPLINYKGLGIRNGDGFGTSDEMENAINGLAIAGKGVFAMKAFGGGNLTGHYLEALDYVTSIEGIDSVMVGIGAENEIDRLVEYMDGTIDRDYVPDVSDKKIYINQGDCEGCGTCMEKCPNNAIFRNEGGLAEVDHDICLTCGYCAPVCPVRAIILY